MPETTQKENSNASRLQEARRKDAQAEGGAGENQNDDDKDKDEQDTEKGAPLRSGQTHKIDFIQGLLMLSVALILDGVEFLVAATIIAIPINWIFWIFGSLGFFIWLSSLGISLNDARGKRAWMILGGGSLIEFIGLGALPGWTLYVIGQI